MVTAANVSDNEAGKALLARLAAEHPAISKAWVDSGYKAKAAETAPPWESTSTSCRPPAKAEASR